MKNLFNNMAFFKENRRLLRPQFILALVGLCGLVIFSACEPGDPVFTQATSSGGGNPRDPSGIRISDNFISSVALFNLGIGTSPSGHLFMSPDPVSEGNLEQLFSAGDQGNYLVGYWKFDQLPIDGNGALNVVNKGNTGVNGVLSPNLSINQLGIGPQNHGLSFNQDVGDDRFVNMGTDVAYSLASSEASIMGWIYLEMSPSGVQYIMRKGSGVDWALKIDDFTGQLSFVVGTTPHSGGPKIPLRKWTHFAVTITDNAATKMLIYVNGKLGSGAISIGNLSSSSTNFIVGKAGNKEFFGRLDDLSLWSKALSATEIARVFDRQSKQVGIYTSKLFNLTLFPKQVDFHPSLQFPMGKELLNFSQKEVQYKSYNISMADNLLLYHFDEKSVIEPFSQFEDRSQASNPPGGECGNSGEFSCPSPITTGVFAGAMRFNRNESDAIYVAHDDRFEVDKGTFSFWLRYGTLDSGQVQTLISKEVMGDGQGGFFRIYTTTNRSIKVNLESLNGGNLTTNYVETAQGELQLHRWHHVAFTFGSAGMNLYLDGLNQASITYSGGLFGAGISDFKNREGIVLGASREISSGLDFSGLQQFLDGDMDEFSFWGRQFTDSEVRGLYLRGSQDMRFEILLCQTDPCNSGENFQNQSNFTVLTEASKVNPLDEHYDISSLLNSKKYLQYRAVFTTRNPGLQPANLPLLLDLTLEGK